MIAHMKSTTTLTLDGNELHDLIHAVSKAVHHMEQEHLTATASYTQELLDVLMAAEHDALEIEGKQEYDYKQPRQQK